MQNLDQLIEKHDEDGKSSWLNPFADTMSWSNKVYFLLYLADTNLILAQRNAEWCGHGPILEQDIALTNISLDLLGVARNFYQYAALVINEQSANFSADTASFADIENPAFLYPEQQATEDSLAYLRTERAFKNLLITELPRGDWAQTILRQFFVSVYSYLLYEQLQKNNDRQLAAIAGKAIKEVTYHIKWSGEWVIRLGDGTEESSDRINKAIDYLWMYTGEFFIPEDFERQMVDEVSLASIKQRWFIKIGEIFAEATLTVPANTYMQTGGKSGIHTEHLGLLLAQMQYLQRTYPGAEW